jgi:hypothetical protein
MSRGKYLSFEEARKYGQLDQFAKESPSVGDEERFEKLTKAMALGKKPSKKKKPKAGTSNEGSSED